jgi:hypothetical protein
MAVGIRCADDTSPSIRKSWLADYRPRSLIPTVNQTVREPAFHLVARKVFVVGCRRVWARSLKSVKTDSMSVSNVPRAFSLMFIYSSKRLVGREVILCNSHFKILFLPEKVIQPSVQEIKYFQNRSFKRLNGFNSHTDVGYQGGKEVSPNIAFV